MLTALTVIVASPTTPPLLADLTAAGMQPIGPVGCPDLVRRAVASAPDMIVCYDPNPTPALFEALGAVNATAPCPLMVFTSDPDAEKMARAVAAGVSAYVVNGYAPGRLRSVVQMAMTRHKRDRALLDELAGLGRRFEERQAVDRAKGILMGAGQLREDEAYRALRAAAMSSKQRLGQVSRQVIDAARDAEAVNRAGSFRMLSQRLVNLYAQVCAGISVPAAVAGVAAATGQVDDTLQTLGRSLSRATFGDLLDAVSAQWRLLKPALDAPASARLAAVDALAEDLLGRAEQLTNNLEIAHPTSSLHVINVAGRQRMLSQRLAKAALLGVLLDAAASRAALVEARRELSAGLDVLAKMPLTSPAIQADLATAAGVWAQLEPLLDRPARGDGLHRIAALADTLLAGFEQLTDRYEKGMQAMIFRA